jgi:23S rRNA (cytosine1962-C5)-methyltransferase
MQALLDAIARMEPPTDAQRIFHGRGGLHPGCEHLALDAFPPVLVLTSFQPLGDDALAAIGDALVRRWNELAPAQPLNWVYQLRQPAAPAETRLMAGEVPDPHVVTEAGARYRVHVLRGQNHGLFLDMAEGRRWVHSHVAAHPEHRFGLKVLNLFAYTCAFSVVALQAGARQVMNAPEMGTQFLTSQMQEVAPGLEFVERLANPATFADIDAERSLKVLVYKAPDAPDAAA